ncbi:MAG TPA: DUF4386 domain-containing protein [Pyrinomonadaceae bacterium]|nr:DUF4386 domain-containing protein [Pyrinomonadaceae bacterium]
MSLIKNPGRRAGLLYLLLPMSAPLRLIYIPAKLFVAGDAAATANNITTYETLFRLGMAAELFAGVAGVFLTLAFYELFKQVNRRLAVLVVILGGVLPSALYFANVWTDAAALTLARGGGGLLTARGGNALSAFDESQRQALMMFFLHLHNQVINAAQIFWGVWLLPLALLIYRSRFLPRFVAIWLIANGVGYVALSLVVLLLPQYAANVRGIVFPALIGELVLILWLVIRGMNMEKWKASQQHAG